MGRSAGKRRRGYGRRRPYVHRLRLEDYVDARAGARTQLDGVWAALRQLCADLPPVELRRVDAAPAPARSHAEAPIELRLVEHLLSFYVPLDAALEAGAPLWMGLLERGEVEADLHALARLDQPGLAAALLVFRPFWCRPAASWAGEDRAALLEHLFARYPVPRFLLDTWRDDPRSILSRWLPWLITLGQGGSLRRLSRLARARSCPGAWPELGKRLCAQLVHVPDTLGPRLGIMYAEVLRLGGSALEVRRLMSDDSYAIEPLVAAPEEREFWTKAVLWLTHHRAQLDDARAASILAWARHQHSERRRAGAEAFRWSGRSPHAAAREAEAYARELERLRETMKPRSRWRRHGWDWGATLDGVYWRIRELLSDAELVEEGRRMRHCVAGYAHGCVRGHAAIFSVSRDRAPCLTVELQLPSRRIVQVAGRRNRTATRGELRVLEQWRCEIVAGVGSTSTSA